MFRPPRSASDCNASATADSWPNALYDLLTGVSSDGAGFETDDAVSNIGIVAMKATPHAHKCELRFNCRPGLLRLLLGSVCGQTHCHYLVPPMAVIRYSLVAESTLLMRTLYGYLRMTRQQPLIKKQLVN
jgi:hypothetical protein